MEFAAEELSERILSDLTDGEEDDECLSSAQLVELPSVVVREYSRCLKRRYDDAFVDVDKPRKWNKSSRRRRMHEQFELLRAVVPDFCSDEKSSILTGACEYIAKLQRLELELRCELPDIDLSTEEEGVSGCDDQESCRADSNAGAEASSSYCWSHCSLVTVEVKRTEEGLQMHVECETRPGLMLRMMEMLESWGLSMDEANIECVDQRLIFDGTGSTEVEEDDGEKRTARDFISAEFVGARLRSLIGDQTQEAMMNT